MTFVKRNLGVYNERNCCILIYRFMHIYTYICWIHTDAMNNRRASEAFFNKIYTPHLICNVCVREGVGDRTERQYFDPHSYGRQRCVFLVLQSHSTGGPEAHSAGFLNHILSAISLNPNSSGAPRVPSAWCGFPYHISSHAIWFSISIQFSLI